MRVKVTITIDDETVEQEGSPEVMVKDGLPSLPWRAVTEIVQKLAEKALAEYAEKHWG